MSSPSLLSSADLQNLLALPDLTRQPGHAVTQMVDLVAQAAEQMTQAHGLSLARPPQESEEALTEAVLRALEGCLQEIRMGGTWTYEELPERARQRLGLAEGQVNKWSHQVYRACHAGSSWTYCP